MSSNVSLPYYAADEECVDCGRWHYNDAGGNAVHLQEEGVPGWDYNRELVFFREVAIDVDALRTACRLPHEVPLMLTATVECPSSRYRECLAKSRLSESGSYAEMLRLQVDSRRLSDSVKLRTEIVLEEKRTTAEPFTARLSGSRLFMQEEVVQLEGNRSRFPIKDADFEEELFFLRAPRAYWHLHWSKGNMETPAVSALMLYLNVQQREFLQRASENDPAVVPLIHIDAARQLISEGLCEEDFVQAPPGDFPEGSVGDVIDNLIAAAFSTRSKEEVRQLMEQDRAKFESAIQNAFAKR